jgi:hypothetical protein
MRSATAGVNGPGARLTETRRPGSTARPHAGQRGDSQARPAPPQDSPCARIHARPHAWERAGARFYRHAIYGASVLVSETAAHWIGIVAIGCFVAAGIVAMLLVLLLMIDRDRGRLWRPVPRVHEERVPLSYLLRGAS